MLRTILARLEILVIGLLVVAFPVISLIDAARSLLAYLAGAPR